MVLLTSCLSKSQLRNTFWRPVHWGFLCAVDSLFFTLVFCSLAPFSGWTLLHINLWGPHWPLGGMSTVGIHPIDEKFPPLAAFLCLVQAFGTEGYEGNWQSNLSTISPGNSIISLHSLETFAWKKRPRMPVRPNNAYHILLHRMKSKTLYSISRRFHFHSRKVVQHYILSCSFLCF